ncbi:hypothetical protein [Pseudodesulfovibrio sp. zrk46]|uniref:cytidylyltransferase domain-containing protein n=1 Tax=Pseudodesulfovibrio sp. zrk46 TaxID=2725288 RepID=UPI0014497FD3|nr:hypothetical protein [Pseudodesulfovibrio sp. zrk46]QJB55740.1 hypothetical protein HFN16_04690 [Pseudodesulfovibrio sp. zrk46]
MTTLKRMAMLQDFTGAKDLETKITVLSYVLSDQGFEYNTLLKDYGVSHETVERWVREYHQCHQEAMAEKGDDSTENVLAVIMSRKGSTGLPNKALRDLNGTKVIGHTLEACSKSRYINKFVVTTDGNEIGDYAASLGAHVIKRPDELGINFMELIIVMNHALLNLGMFHDYWPDMTLNLFPTHPFRTVEDLDEAIGELIEEGHFASISREPIPQVSGKQVYFKVGETLQHFSTLSHNKKYYCQRAYINAFNNRSKTGKWTYKDIHGAPCIDIDTPDDIAFAKQCCKPVTVERFTAPYMPEASRTEASDFDDFVACVKVDNDLVYRCSHHAQDILEMLNRIGFKHVVLCGKDKRVINSLHKVYPETMVFPNMVNAFGWPSRQQFDKFLESTDLPGVTVNRFLNVMTLDSGLPFITEEMIVMNVMRYKENYCRPTVSTSIMPSDFHLYKLAAMKGGMLRPIHPNYIGYRQLFPTLYIEDGLIRCSRYGDLTKRTPAPILAGHAQEQKLLMNVADDEYTYRKITAKCDKLHACSAE